MSPVASPFLSKKKWGKTWLYLYENPKCLITIAQKNEHIQKLSRSGTQQNVWKKKHHIGKLKYSKTSHTQQYHTITICNIQVIKFNCLLIQ